MIAVDGQLVEPEWVEARVLEDFRVTKPLTRGLPAYATVARVLAQPEALFVGVRVTHPEAQRIRSRSPRDAQACSGTKSTIRPPTSSS